MDGVRGRRPLRRFRAPEVSRAWFTLRPDALCIPRRIQHPYSVQHESLLAALASCWSIPKDLRYRARAVQSCRLPCNQICVTTPPAYTTARLAHFLSSLQRIRYLDFETIGSIGRVSSQIRCRLIRLPPTKPVYAQRRIRGVRDQGDAAGRGWGVSVSNQESNRVARARRKRERVEQGV